MNSGPPAPKPTLISAWRLEKDIKKIWARNVAFLA
jgi:hypothetical protein